MTGGRNQQGSALVVVLVMVVVLSGLSVLAIANAFQKNTSTEVLVENSQSLHVAEAGVDRAIAEINCNAAGILGTHGPFNLGSGSYTTTVTDWFTDGIDNDGANGVDDVGEQFHYTILCTATGNLGAKDPVQKQVEAIVRRQPFTGFARAMFGKDQVTLGGTVFTDSYDSALGTYAAQAVNVDPHVGVPVARYKGDIGSNGPIGDVGTVDVFGNSTAGPGFSTTITSNCYIHGSTAPSPVPIPMPDVVYDPPAGCPPVPNNGTTASTLTNSAVLNGGSYRCAAVRLANHQVLQITGNVTLYVDGDILVTAKEEVRITGSGKLTIYHGSGSIHITGGSNTNTSGKPETLMVYSATTDSVNAGGNSTFTGCIYAPNSPTQLEGNTEYFGSVTGKSIKCQGTVDFHYDEALGRMNLVVPGPCEVRSWREIPR